ncbi:MAG: T9SS type A sorting domain-containing protein [Bacteroidia bacterium]|nr:T9SS type A sorting domain-containing protein [Bacteroidia bacterium]MBP9689223.1 T9SS type A sorting domain-containing protein [Bacteroidia bacterium]
MKKIILSLSILGLTFSTFAQTPITDSIQAGASYSNDAYYSLKNGLVKTAPNSEWQLAFSIGSFNVAVRTNATTSSSGNGSVTTYEKAGRDTSVWNNFDTTNYKFWNMVENSDEDWETGALNRNGNSQFDYGWGEYDQTSHAVTGNRIYLLVINNAGVTVFKKLWIKSKNLGKWLVTYEDINGSNTKTITLNSSDFAGKNFVYLSVLNDSIIDREPAKTEWDFVLTRYKAYQPQQSIYYPSTGVLTNANVVTAEARGVAVNDALLNTFIADTSSNISTIGADWKQLNGTTFQFYVVDSLCYFVKANDGAFWKLVFTKFAGSSTGNIVFNKTKLTSSTGIINIGKEVNNLTVYPNPATNNITVLFNATNNMSTISILDISGRVVKSININQTTDFNTHQINLNDVQKGIYFLQVLNGNSSSIQKIIIQ